jgi:toxin ParE1/3/4
MRVVYTDPARTDLEEIRTFLTAHYPLLLPTLERRIRHVTRRISMWPESSPVVSGRHGVRVASLSRFPYKIFYHVISTRIEILHVHHSARDSFI